MGGGRGFARCDEEDVGAAAVCTDAGMRIGASRSFKCPFLRFGGGGGGPLRTMVDGIGGGGIFC